ncbi:FAD binding domain-containing protein [Mycena polygramma]|nr:FAD binding domain-containing protein [Mycena polygramma]
MAQPSVLIAGSGPTGLILAITLLKNGVPIRIINAESKHRIGSKGAGIQPRTLELYDILGVLPGIMKFADTELGLRRMYELPGGSKVLKELPVVEYVAPTPATPYTNPVSLSQEVHEEILRGYLRALGGRVELGTALRSFEQFSNHVVAHLARTDADGTEHTEVATFDWLVGADGVHSVVRKQLGLSFLGETKEEAHVLVGDIDVDEGLDRPVGVETSHTMGQLTLHKSSGIIGCLRRRSYTGGPEQWRHIMPTRDEFIEEFYTVTGRRDIKFGAVTWMSSFKPSMCMVDRFGIGRVFVAGDAAHCHSPTGGQGLNSSVQDAVNLGWKLALVANHRAPAALLDSYSAERLPVIAEMLKLTTALYEKTAVSSTRAGDAAAWEQASARGGALGMLGVNTRGSTIVLDDGAGSSGAYAESQTAPGRVQAGYRAPDAPGLVNSDGAATRLFDLFGPATHTVLVYGGDAARHDSVKRALGKWPKGTQRTVLVRRAWETAGVESASVLGEALVDRLGHAYAAYAGGSAEGEMLVVVVRPDGVIGAVVSQAAGIERYWGLIFGKLESPLGLSYDFRGSL